MDPLWLFCLIGIHLKRDIPARGTANDDGSYAPVVRCAICKTKI